MFDLNEYLNRTENIINESLQSTTFSKNIINNPAKNFNYLTLFSQNKKDNSSLSQHEIDDLNSSDLFKYIPFTKYQNELFIFLINYIKYKHNDINRNTFMNYYRRYMIIFREWEKAINKGIYGNDMSVIKSFDGFLKYTSCSNFSELTDSNFRRYTFKEAKKAGSEFTNMKRGCILFFFTSEEQTIKEKYTATGNITVPKDSLIGISVGDTIIYDIRSCQYKKMKDTVETIKNVGFKDIYELELSNNETLEIPYICGLRNLFLSKNLEYKNIRKMQEDKLLREFKLDLNNFVEKQNVDEYKDELSAILNKMDICEIGYFNFKFDFSKCFLFNKQKLGNIFSNKNEAPFGVWGNSNNDYIYVLTIDPKYTKDGDYAYTQWKNKKALPYAGANSYVYNYYRRTNSNDNRNNKDVLTKSEKDFIQRFDVKSGKMDNKNIIKKEDNDYKLANLQRYTNKLETLKNINSTTNALIKKINHYKNVLSLIKDTHEKALDVDIISNIDKFDKDGVNSNYKDILELQKQINSIQNNFLNYLNLLIITALSFSQSNKNYLDGKFLNAFFDLDEYTQEILQTQDTNSIVLPKQFLDDEICSKFDFKIAYEKLKGKMRAICDTLDKLCTNFEDLKDKLMKF